MTIKNRFPSQRPDFSLDFNNTERIPPGVFSRASTGTYIGSNGLIQGAAINEPRFNYHLATGENLGLLVEEARTNSYLRSQEIDAAFWLKSNITVTPNAGLAPDGTMTADLVTTASIAGTRFLRATPTPVSETSSDYCISCYAKVISGTGNAAQISLNSTNAFIAPTFASYAINLDNFTEATAGTFPSIRGYTVFPDGWIRVYMVFNTLSQTNVGLDIRFGANNVVSTFHVWGLQLEKGSFPTSYIPTTSATVTRAADIFSINDAALPAAMANGGALFVETNNTLLVPKGTVLSLNNGSTVNELLVRNLPLAGGTTVQSTISGITTSTDIIGGSSIFENSFALRIKADDFALASSSQPIVTASGAVPAFTQIKIGSSFAGGDGFAGTIKRLAFYSDELNNQKLEGISSKPATVPPSAAEPVLYMLIVAESPNFAWNLRSTGTVNYNVDWGDGQTELAQTLNTKPHTYALPGIYKVVVRLNSGTWRPFYSSNVDILAISAIAFTGVGWSFGTNLSQAFMGGQNIASINNIDTTAVTLFTEAWRFCPSLTSFPLIDTAAGTNFTSAWLFCTGLTSFPLINTAAGTAFNGAWQNCSSLTSFPLINTSSGILFNSAWNGCSSLTSFPLINTAAGTAFNNAWQNCSSLTSFPLINTAAGTNFNNAWNGCTSLTSFPLINTAAGTNFTGAWRSCTSLTSFPLINTAAGTNLGEAWIGCTSLTSFPLIDTAASTNFGNAWNGCSSLTSFPLINTALGITFGSAWRGCASLTSFPLINTAAGTSFAETWFGCASLTSFPAAMFDSCLATNFTNCWGNCALTAASIENIIVSIESAGTSSGTLAFTGGTNAIKSSWTAPANAAYDALVARGWTITFRT